MTEQREKKPHKQYKRRGHGEGSVFELKGSKRRKPWVAQITLENGEKKQTYHGTQKEAIAALRKKLNEHGQGILATGPQQKLKDYLAYWLEEVHKDSLRLSTYARYRILVYTHIIPVLGHIPVQKLTPQQVQSLYTQELKEGKATGSVRLMHTVLHLALDNAVRWGLVPRNVCDLVDPPRPAPQEAQILTLEQAHKLLEVAKGHRLETLLVTAITTGMRHGELLGLKWRDIDFEQRSLQVRRTVVFLARHGYREHKPKTAKGHRKMVVPQVVLESLKAHRVHQLETKLKAGPDWHDLDLVFCNAHGYYMSSNNLRSQFRKLLRASGLPGMRIHDLRHSAATILLSMGVPPHVVQEILGHSHINVTLGIYGHVLPGMQRDAMEGWDTLL